MGWGWGQRDPGASQPGLGKNQMAARKRTVLLKVPLIFYSRDWSHLKVSQCPWLDGSPTPSAPELQCKMAWVYSLCKHMHRETI